MNTVRPTPLCQVLVALLCVSMTFFPAWVWALPSGERVAAGSAQFARNGNALTITTSDKVIINYNAFSIAGNELVRFLQPGAGSVALNRVTGIEPSQIFGVLSANGRIILINPNGILFGKGATVDVQGLIASTLNMTDANFLKGNYLFEGSSQAAVVNQGTLKAGAGGVLYLFAAKVDNQGAIQGGQDVQLLAGQKVLVSEDPTGQILVQVEVPQGAATQDGAAVSNSGTITAPGGRVVLGGGGLYGQAVNQSGVINADSIQNQSGTIVLSATKGDVINTGSLSAKATGENSAGGTIRVTGDRVYSSGNLSVDGGDGGRAGSIEVVGREKAALGGSGVVSAKGVGLSEGGTVLVNATQGGTLIGSNVVVNVSGGNLGGNAGRLEVSAAGGMVLDGTLIGAAQPGYQGGSLYIDPAIINIITTGPFTTIADDTNFSNPDVVFGALPSTLNLNPSVGQNFNGFSNIFLQATDTINVNSAFNLNTATGLLNVGLRLEARNNLNVNAPITADGEGSITLTADADLNGTGTLAQTATAAISGASAISLSGAVVNLLGTVSSSAGNVTVSGLNAVAVNSVSSGGGLGINIASANSTVTANGTLTATVGGVSIGALGGVTVKDVTAGSAGIDIESGGAMSLTGNITSTGGSIVLISDSDGDGVGDLTQAAGTTINAGSGDILINTLFGILGPVFIALGGGVVTINGTLQTTAGAIVINSPKTVTLSSTSLLKTEGPGPGQGDVLVTAKGNLLANGAINTSLNALAAQPGNAANTDAEGELADGTGVGNIALFSQKGSVTQAATSVIQSGQGDITITGKTVSLLGALNTAVDGGGVLVVTTGIAGAMTVTNITAGGDLVFCAFDCGDDDGDGIVLISKGNLTINGNLDASANLSTGSWDISLLADSDRDATGDFLLAAGKSVKSSHGDITINNEFSGNTVTLTGNLETTGAGNVNINGRKTITVAGTIKTNTAGLGDGEAVGFDAVGGSVHIRNTGLFGAGNVVVNGTIDTSIPGTPAEGLPFGLGAGTIFLESSRGLVSQGATSTLKSSSGAITVSGTGVNFLGTVNSLGGAVNLTATGLTGNLAAANVSAGGTGSITLSSGGNVTMSGNVTAGGSVTINADTNENGAGDVTLAALKTITANDGNINISGQTITLTGAVTAPASDLPGGDITIDGKKTVVVNNITSGDADSIGGDIRITSRLGVTLNGNISTFINGAVTVVADDDGNNSGSVLQAAGKSIVSGDGGISISGKAATLNGTLDSVTNGNGLIDISAPGAVLVNAVASGDTLMVQSFNSTVTANGTLTGAGAVTVDGGGNVTLKDVTSQSGTIHVTSGATVTLAGNLTATGGGIDIASDTANNGVGDVVLAALKTINGSDHVNINACVHCGEAVTLTGAILSNGTVTIAGRKDVTVGAVTANSGTLGITSLGKVTVNGALLNGEGGGAINITADADSNGTGDVISSVAGTMTTLNGISGRILVSGQAITLLGALNAATDVDVGGKQAVTVNNILANAGGTGSITLSSGGNVTMSGNVTAGGSVTINADTNENGAGDVTLAALKTITANDGNINISGQTITLTGAVTAPASDLPGGDITIDGKKTVVVNNITSGDADSIGGDIRITSRLGVTLNGNISTFINGAVTVVADDDGNNSGSVLQAAGKSIVSGDGGISISGKAATLNGTLDSVTNGNGLIDISAPGAVLVNAVASGDTLMVQSFNSTVTANGTLTGAGAVTVDGGGNVTLKDVTSQSGTIHVTSGATVTLAGNLTATGGGIDIASDTANNGVGDVVLAALKTINGSDHVNINACVHCGEAVTLTGAILSNGTVTIAGRKDVTVGAVTANSGTLGITSLGKVTVNGALLNGEGGGAINITADADSNGTGDVISSVAGTMTTLNGISGRILVSGQAITLLGALNAATDVDVGGKKAVTVNNILANAGGIVVRSSFGVTLNGTLDNFAVPGGAIAIAADNDLNGTGDVIQKLGTTIKAGSGGIGIAGIKIAGQAVTLNGALATTGDVDIFGHKAVLVNNITAGGEGGIGVASSLGVTINGNLDSRGVNPGTGAPLAANDTPTSTGGIIIISDSDVNGVGDVILALGKSLLSGDGTIRINPAESPHAGQAVLLNGSIITRFGNVEINGNKAVTLGNITTKDDGCGPGGNITVSSPVAITVNGNLDTAAAHQVGPNTVFGGHGTITLTATNEDETAVLTQAATSLIRSDVGSVQLAGDAATLSGTVHSLHGNITAAATGEGKNLTVNTMVSGGASGIKLSAGGNAETLLTGSGVQPGGNILVNGDLNSRGFNFSATGLPTPNTTGGAPSSGDISILASGDVTQVAGKAMRSGHSIFINSTIIPQNVNVGTEEAPIIESHDFLASTGFGNNVTLNSPLTADNGSVAINARKNIVIGPQTTANAVTAGDSLFIASSKGNVTVGGPLSEQGAGSNGVILSAGGNVTVNANVTTTNGNVAVQSDADNNKAGDVILALGKIITAGGDVIIGHGIDLTSVDFTTETVKIFDAIASQNVTLTGNLIANAKAVVAGNKAVVIGNITAGTVDVFGKTGVTQTAGTSILADLLGLGDTGTLSIRIISNAGVTLSGTLDTTIVVGTNPPAGSDGAVQIIADADAPTAPSGALTRAATNLIKTGAGDVLLNTDELATGQLGGNTVTPATGKVGITTTEGKVFIKGVEQP